MIFCPYHYFDTGCAAYLFGCGTLGKCAVVDAQERDVEADVPPKPAEREHVLRFNLGQADERPREQPHRA